jgi:transcriptional regulator with PAS, ATPase and Fis domain
MTGGVAAGTSGGVRVAPEVIADSAVRAVAAREDGFANGFAALVGRGPAFGRTVHRARQLAQIEAPILLRGDTGVGKEVFARAIHASGRQQAASFVAVNCGGLPRELLASELFGYVDGAFTGARRAGMVGKIEAARGGTLFLDEISEMPLDLQPYLLRVLEGGEIYRLGSATPRTVRFRLIAACNRDLRAEVKSGRFREDLFYRISVTSLQIPALRERKEDLPDLVSHFAREATRRHGLPEKRIDSNVFLALARHDWPGNLRELRNVVESMVLLTDGDVVHLDALPPEFPFDAVAADDAAMPPTSNGLEDVEREVIGATLRSRRGNLARAAKDLGISRSTLYLKVKRYELDPALAEIRFAARRAGHHGPVGLVP